ncbi:MFS transporter [Nocardioides sp. SYSU D00038]|uniref:MFS transporter n=1 Tax=Nocardioides sp. SYSU D00038 TaxID=2812554 RepID=UPI00196775C9|nr:MFS transporter [Nocardioides sp. SYSU D00038]
MSDAPPSTATDRAPLTVVALCFGGMSASLTQTLVIPLQGDLPRLLGTSVSNAGWVVTVTLLAAAVAMPVSGRLGDILGKQRVLVASAAILAVGSVVCALSTSLAPMLVGRALQGVAMGFIPVGIALMREVTPPRLTGTAIAAMSATLGVGGAIGLPLSAWVAQSFDWHAVFWMAAIMAALTSLGVLFVVPHVHDAHPGRIDFLGGVGLGVGLVGVLVGVSKAHDWGWGSGRTVGAIVGGVAVLLVWGSYQLRRDEPLVDLRTSARRPVLLTNVAAVAIGFGMMAQAIVVPQLLQLPRSTGFGMGQTMLEAGLWMAPGGLMMLLFAPVSSRLLTNVGPKLTLMVGGSVLGVGYLVAFFLMNAAWELAVASIIASAGVGIGYAAMPTMILGAVPMAEAGAAVGINSLMRSVGTTVASAVMTTVLAGSVTAAGLPTRGAYEACFLIGAVAAFVGVAITALVPHVHVRPAATERAVEAAAA